MLESKLDINVESQLLPLNRYFQECIGSCLAYLTMREDFRKHVNVVQKGIGFNNIRCHGIFHDWVGAYKEVNGEPVFNFQNVNKIYDFFVESGLKPYVELSFMPKDLASAPDTVFRYKANISPPKDMYKWHQLINAFVSHLIDRYGLEEVRTWYFEVWNEPDLTGIFWSGTQQEYFELYKETATTIKSIDAKLKVGGPSTSKNQWIREFLDYCEGSNLPVDFVSTHHYCADAALEEDADVFELEYRGQKAMVNDVKKTVGFVRESAYPDAEIHYSEWNVSPCHEDRFGKDSEFTAAFMLQTLKDMDGLVDAYSFWCLSDIFEETGPGSHPFSGKYGLLNINGIKKPVYFAYHFLANLFNFVYPSDDESSYITTDGNGNYRVLCWNYTEPSEVDFNGGDYQVPTCEKALSVALQGLTGTYRILGFLVDQESGNSYRNWQKMGAPQYLSKAQELQLEAASEPNVIVDKIIDVQHSTELAVTLNSNAHVFFEVQKLK